MKKNWIRKIGMIAGWLLLWQLVSFFVKNDILLVGPVEALMTLGKLILQREFWEACIGTCMRISLGFVAGTMLGVLFAVGSARFGLVEEILAPPMTLIKAVPVASFVVIFLIWWGSAQLATVISFCIVLPNLYINILEGIKSTDKKLLEMAQVFQIPVWNQLFYIYRPAVKPFLDSAVKLAAGMSWKSGVAAEVIGLPEHAIGEQLYMSKIYLDTSGVLAWTVVTILLSVGFEKMLMCLWKWFCAWEPSCLARKSVQRKEIQGLSVKLNEVMKAYHGKPVVEALSAEYLPGQVYYFHSPSGSGKTTLFRLVAGLEKPDRGTIETNEQRIAYLFQEDRLCEEYSALKNVELVTGNPAQAKAHLLQLLEEADIDKPVKELSGGMKRRAAIARTIAADADIILLDEPYNGLDEENRKRVKEYMDENRSGKIVLLSSHYVE